jgi:hypothetical protein
MPFSAKATQLPCKTTFFVDINWTDLQKTKENSRISGDNT